VKTPAETPKTGSTELETVGTVYHMAKRDNSSYREEPTTAPELQTKERKVLQSDSKDSENDDVSERRHRKGKAETEIEQVEHGKSSHHVSPDFSYREEPLTKQDMEIKGEEGLPRDQPHDSLPERRCRKRETEIDAKAGTTRHLSRYPDGMSARITDAADAKAGQTQHPSSSNNSIPMPNRRRIRISKQPEMKTPGRKPNTQKCRWDKTEWRRAKRQSRHNGKLPAATPAEGDHITDDTLQDMTRQEMLKAIERTRQGYADSRRTTIHQRECCWRHMKDSTSGLSNGKIDFFTKSMRMPVA